MSTNMKSVRENYDWHTGCGTNNRVSNSKCVARRCVAVILVPKSNVTNFVDTENFVSNGQDIFDDFILRNKTCYWNPALVDSVKSLRYQGFMHPNTLLVGGDELSLENLRTAWGRRVLNAPSNFIIDKIGDVNPIQMEVIPQTNFVPLPEALCLVIMDLNSCQVIATLDVIRERLQRYYGADTHPPSDQLIYDTLGKLIRERKAFHTGSGYFVVTPDTYRLRSDDLTNTYTTQVSYHPMYVPVVPQQPRIPMKSISCQANMVAHPPARDKSSLSRHQSMRSQKGRGDGRVVYSDGSSHGMKVAGTVYSDGSARDYRVATLPRHQAHSDGSTRDTKVSTLPRSTGEVRSQGHGGYSDGSAHRDKQTNVVAPTVEAGDTNSARNKKTETATKTKAKAKKPKGTRVSLLSKLFGRGKKKTKLAVQSSSAKTVEYATFSGQFPPPEWAWYRQQVEKQQRVEDWVTQVHRVPKSQTWHKLQMNPIPEVESTARPIVKHKPPHIRSARSTSHRKNRSHSLPPASKPSHHLAENPPNLDDSICTEINPAHREHEMMTFATPSTIPPGDSFMGPSSVNMRIWPRHSSPIPGDESQSRDDAAPVHVINNDLAGNRQNSFAKRAHRARRRQLRYSNTFVSVNTADMSHEYIGQQSRTDRLLSRSQDSGVNCVGLLGPNVSYATVENSPPAVAAPANNDAKTSPMSSHGDSVSEVPQAGRIRADTCVQRKFADIPEESPVKLNVSRASPDPTESEHSCDTVINNKKPEQPSSGAKPDIKPADAEPSDSGFLSHNCECKSQSSQDSKPASHSCSSQTRASHECKPPSNHGRCGHNSEGKPHNIGGDNIPLTKHDDAIMSDIKNFHNIWKNAEKRLSKEINQNNDHNFHSLDSLLDKDIPLNNQRQALKDTSNGSHSTSHNSQNTENASRDGIDEKILTRKFNMNGDYQVVGIL